MNLLTGASLLALAKSIYFIPAQVNENPPHFIHEIKTIAYDVSDVNVFLLTLMRFLLKKPE